MIGAFIVAVGVVISLVRPTLSTGNAGQGRAPTFEVLPDAVVVSGPRQIKVSSASPLAKALAVITVESHTIHYPLLNVTGSVVLAN